MQIKTIDIRNFLALEQVTLELQAPINLLIGPNEAGKSSIRDALQVALTGQSRGLKTHEQQAGFIYEGAKAADIKITLADDRAISWHKTPKVAATRTGPIPDDAVMTSILADPLHFLSLEDKARREVLFKHIPGLNPTGEMIYERLAGSIPNFDQGSAVPGEMAKLAFYKGFSAAETEAITRRRLAKRTRDDAQVQEPETKATVGGVLRILPDIQPADVEAGLSALRTERDKLQRTRGKVEAQADKLPELEAALATLEAAPPDAPDPDYSVTVFARTLEINRGVLEKLQAKALTMAPGQDPRVFPLVCPAYNIDCPSRGQVAIAGTGPEDVDPQALAQVKADLQEQKKEVGLIEADLKAAKTTQEAFESYTQTHQALVNRVAKLKETQTQAQDTAAIDEQIAALDLRMKTGYELLDAVREFWRKKEAAETAQAKIAQAETEIALYDALAKALAPAGIPSQLIAEALGPVNERLAMASGYLFPDIDEREPLHLSDDLEVRRGVTPYALLSKSARYRTGIAFQVVLAQLAGARLLMVDEADILDPPNRAQLIELLLAVKDDFDRILVFATSDHADPSPIPELAVWWLQDGQAVPVLAKEAA